MPKYSAETFLRWLAVFAESNELDWLEAFIRDQIETRKTRLRAPKDLWVINCDLVKEEGLPAVQKGQITEVGDEEQEEEEEEQSSSLSVSIEENGKTAKPTVAEREASGSLTPVNSRDLPLSSPPPLPPSSVPTLITPATSVSLSAPPAKLVAPKKTLGGKSKAGEEGDVPTTKRRTLEQKRTARIPVINLDVDLKLREMEEEKKEDDQYVRDMSFVKKAMSWLKEQGDDGDEMEKEVLERRMTIICEALSLELE